MLQNTACVCTKTSLPLSNRNVNRKKKKKFWKCKYHQSHFKCCSGKHARGIWPKMVMMIDGPKHSCYFLSTTQTFHRLPSKPPSTLAPTHLGSSVAVPDLWWGSLIQNGLTGNCMCTVIWRQSDCRAGCSRSQFRGLLIWARIASTPHEANSVSAVLSEISPCLLFQNIVGPFASDKRSF